MSMKVLDGKCERESRRLVTEVTENDTKRGKCGGCTVCTKKINTVDREEPSPPLSICKTVLHVRMKIKERRNF